MDRSEYQIGLAAPETYSGLFKPTAGDRYYMTTALTQKEFAKCLWLGQPLFNEIHFSENIREDIKIISNFKPDLVVGDFRLSLAMSCRVLGVPYMNLTNFYWDPKFYQWWELPDSLITHLLPPQWVNRIFRKFFKTLTKNHLNAYLKSCRDWGLSTFINETHKTEEQSSEEMTLGEFYMQGDYKLFCDIKSLVPDFLNNEKNLVLGPMVWSPEIAQPNWWGEFLATRQLEKPLVYLNLGSSGNHQILPKLIRALQKKSVDLIVGGLEIKEKNIWGAKYLPGLDICRMAQLMICNGGSPSTQQALACGIPVIGICNNLDQILNMHSLQKLNVGSVFRSDDLNFTKLADAVQSVLENSVQKENAKLLGLEISQWDLKKKWNEILEKNIFNKTVLHSNESFSNLPKTNINF
jgi:UDP:flavonoid glycosyltransferase YjiC (YdhE family)